MLPRTHPIACLVFISLLAGCAATPRFKPDSKLQEIIKDTSSVMVIILQSDVYRLTSGGVTEKVEDWCDQADRNLREATVGLLKPMEPYFESRANARASAWGDAEVKSPTTTTVTLPGLEIVVDLRDFIDIEAEMARQEKQEQQLLGLIQGKQKKLANEGFVSRAPADVVQRERDSLAQLTEQLAAVRAALDEFRRNAASP